MSTPRDERQKDLFRPPLDQSIAMDHPLVRLADELHQTARVSDQLWTALSAHWEAPQLIELLVIAGMYHTIAYLANGAQVALEDWAARFPPARSEA